MKPNHAAIVNALNLVKKGEVDHAPADPIKMSDSIDNNHFAGMEGDGKTAHPLLPIVHAGKVNADAVEKALAYAKGAGHADVADALGHVSDAIDAHKKGQIEMSIDDDDNGDELLSIGPEDAEALDANVIEGGSDEDNDDLIDDADGDDQITDDQTTPGAPEKALNADGTDPTRPPLVPGTKLSAKTLPPRVSLRSMDIAKGAKPKVEREGNGAIRNVSVMQLGPAEGHGFMIDDKMLDQITGQMKTGTQMRYAHPEQAGEDGTAQPVDPLGTHVGRVTNIRREPGEVRGDIEFGAHAKKVPGLGDVSGYLMDLAENDPAAFGLSTVFAPDDYDVDSMGNPVGRSKAVAACDLTGSPASNRAGLL